MAGLRHDAKVCRSAVKSEQIRLGLGLYTPAEREAHAQNEKRRQQAAQKNAQQGNPLGLEEE